MTPQVIAMIAIAAVTIVVNAVIQVIIGVRSSASLSASLLERMNSSDKTMDGFKSDQDDRWKQNRTEQDNQWTKIGQHSEAIGYFRAKLGNGGAPNVKV